MAPSTIAQTISQDGLGCLDLAFDPMLAIRIFDVQMAMTPTHKIDMILSLRIRDIWSFHSIREGNAVPANVRSHPLSAGLLNHQVC